MIANKLPEFSISLKTKAKASELHKICTPADIAEVARKCFDADSIEWTESFIVMALNRANKVLGFYKVSQGGVAGTVADPRVIYQFALLANACSIVIAHNHPSGERKPSVADKNITQKIKEAGRFLDILLLDHVIITAESYYSFVEEGDL